VTVQVFPTVRGAGRVVAGEWPLLQNPRSLLIGTSSPDLVGKVQKKVALLGVFSKPIHDVRNCLSLASYFLPCKSYDVLQRLGRDWVEQVVHIDLGPIFDAEKLTNIGVGALS
jgi:hypothetical protein